jgi:hypothetical protein
MRISRWLIRRTLEAALKRLFVVYHFMSCREGDVTATVPVLLSHDDDAYW